MPSKSLAFGVFKIRNPENGVEAEVNTLGRKSLPYLSYPCVVQEEQRKRRREAISPAQNLRLLSASVAKGDTASRREPLTPFFFRT